MPKNYDFENVETLPVAKINDNPARSVYTILKAKTAQFINKHLLIPPCQKDDDNNAVLKKKFFTYTYNKTYYKNNKYEYILVLKCLIYKSGFKFLYLLKIFFLSHVLKVI